MALSPNPPKKTRSRLISKYEGKRLSFSDAVKDDDNDQVHSLFNSLDRKLEQQKILKKSTESEWDRKIISKYEGKRLSFSDAVKYDDNDDQVHFLFNSLDRKLEQQKRPKKSTESEWDRKIRILMSMSQKFGEIAFCAITADEQVKGYGFN